MLTVPDRRQTRDNRNLNTVVATGVAVAGLLPLGEGQVHGLPLPSGSRLR